MRRLLLALALLALASPGWANVAFDAFSVELASDKTVSHTPVGTPRAAIVLLLQGASQTSSAVTYGGTSMTQDTLFTTVNAETDFDMELWFLGASIPTGTQDVVVTTTAGAPNIFIYTLTAAADTAVQNTDTSIDTTAQVNPSASLALSGETSFVALGMLSGVNDVSSATPLSGWNSRSESDEGSYINGSYSYDTIGSTDVTCGWTQDNDNAAMLCFAITESGAAGGCGTTIALTGAGCP